MAKIVQNTTASDIFVINTGVNIQANTSYTIPVSDYNFWIGSMDSDIAAGNFVINDGTSDLDAVMGTAWINQIPVTTEVSSSTSTSTNSSSYVSLNSMSMTLPAGTYLVSFYGTFSTTVPLLSNPGMLISIFANGVQQTNSEMSQNNNNNGTPFQMSTSLYVTIGLNQVIETRWKTNGVGNTITCTKRVMDLLRIA